MSDGSQVSDEAPGIPSLPRRAIAKVIDVVLHLVILDAAGGFKTVVPLLWVLSVEAAGVLDATLGLGAAVLHTAVAEAVGGATLGKLVMGLRVRSRDGDSVSFRAGCIRGLLFLFEGVLTLGLVAYSSMIREPEHLRVGDRAAGTVVVASHARFGRAALGAILGVLAAMALLGGSYVVDSTEDRDVEQVAPSD